MTQTATLDLGNEKPDLVGRIKTTFARRTEGRAVIFRFLRESTPWSDEQGDGQQPRTGEPRLPDGP